MSASHPPYVLVVEDESTIADVQIEHLRAAGLRVDCLSRGDLVEGHVRAMPPDLVLLDVMLPGMDGTDVCRALRRFSQVPIIMVTSRSDERDRLLGFDMGADDYVCKPFSPKELVARVRAALRRGHPARAGSGSTGATASVPSGEIVVLDEAKQRVLCLGQALELTPHEYRLLTVMLAQPGRVFSRASLLEQSYDDPTGVFDRAIDSHVKNLRKKFAAIARKHAFIHSVYGLGYRYQVEAADAGSASALPGMGQTAQVPVELKPRLPAFLASRSEGIDEMQRALEGDRREELRRTAHRLAGSFALYGFTAAARSCQRMESMAEQSTREQLHAALTRLRNHLATVDIQYVETDPLSE